MTLMSIDSLQVVIKFGFPVRTLAFKTIKLFSTILVVFLVIDVLFSCKLFVSAVQIRGHLGYFINMISSGGGDTLPSLQAIPVLFFLLVNLGMGALLYFAFDGIARPSLNRLMFILVLVGTVLLCTVLVIIICVIAHAYSSHENLHDGIVTAMRNYSSNTLYKKQLDRLQIEFQCCGSRKYDEWYRIKWMDPSLEQATSGSSADGNTPFSCCSMKSLFPCIHHNIEKTGKAYLYTPEFNLSISTRGCYDIIREKKQEIGWQIVVNLLVFFLLEVVTTILFRCIQSAHFPFSRFHGHLHNYVVWIFGCYIGRVKKDDPPPTPPLPDELK